MDRTGQIDPVAVRQAQRAYGLAQTAAVAIVGAAALAREGAARVSARKVDHSVRRNRSRAVSRVQKLESTEVERRRPKRRVLGWWTVFAMLLAWFGSVPISVVFLADSTNSLAWENHLLVTLPTAVSFPPMLCFLWTAPRPRPRIARFVKAVLLAPVFLVVGLLAFLFTAGVGSFVFGWLVLKQARLASDVGSAVT